MLVALDPAKLNFLRPLKMPFFCMAQNSEQVRWEWYSKCELAVQWWAALRIAFTCRTVASVAVMVVIGSHSLDLHAIERQDRLSPSQSQESGGMMALMISYCLIGDFETWFRRTNTEIYFYLVMGQSYFRKYLYQMGKVIPDIARRKRTMFITWFSHEQT